MKFRYFLILLLISASCSTSRKAVKPVTTASSEEYIRQYKDLAVQEMKRVGIPASITLAQGMLESGYGNSTLAVEGKNHFGIKCHSTWNGKKIYHDDDRRQECFRKYRSVYESFKDHSEFLTSSQRYDFLFQYDRTNYKKWARGLKRAGYATSPTYATRLIELIERYQLYRFDRQERRFVSLEDKSHGPLGNVDNFRISPEGHRVRTRNRVDYIVVKAGDTFKSLNRELDLMPWELRKYNELSDTAELHKGQVLYLQPKRNKAERGFDVHLVREGETLHSISQLYGIKQEKLYERNDMEEGDKLKPGDKIWLRKERPSNAGDK